MGWRRQSPPSSARPPSNQLRGGDDSCNSHQPITTSRNASLRLRRTSRIRKDRNHGAFMIRFFRGRRGGKFLEFFRRGRFPLPTRRDGDLRMCREPPPACPAFSHRGLHLFFRRYRLRRKKKKRNPLSIDVCLAKHQLSVFRTKTRTAGQTVAVAQADHFFGLPLFPFAWSIEINCHSSLLFTKSYPRHSGSVFVRIEAMNRVFVRGAPSGDNSFLGSTYTPPRNRKVDKGGPRPFR